MKIEYNFFHWGPFLWKTTLPDSFCEELLLRGQHTQPEKQEKICSIITDVKRFENNDDLVWFATNFQPYVESYLSLKNEYLNNNENILSVELLSLWINYQKQYETNPEHTHSGDLSFVIYLQIPDELVKENSNYKGRSAGPGGIKFRYGEKTDYTVSDHYFLPKQGDLFIFPANLAHEAYSFYSNCTRISVAGNLKFIKNEH
jgi:hypothetical protein